MFSRVRIFLFIFLFFIFNSVNIVLSQNYYSNDIGNKIKQKEFPDSKQVEPLIDSKSDVIQGNVENCIEVNLEDCLKFALGNNPRIQSAMQDVFASNARVRQTWASYFPQIGWQTGYTRIRQLQLSDVFKENLVFNYFVLGQISASQMLYDFGVTQNQVTIRKLDQKGYKIILTGTVNDVICEVKKAYYNLQYSIEAKSLAEEMVLRYSAFYEQAKAFYEVGIKPKVDVTIAEVNLSSAKLNLIQAENSVDISIAKLNNAIGMPYNNKFLIKDHLMFLACDIELEKAIQVAEKSRPEFQLSQVKVEEARQNVKLVKKSFFPQLSLEGQYQIGGSSPASNYGYNFGGYLNFPTINGMLLRNEIKEARALYLKEKSIAKLTQNNIYYEIQEAYYSLIEKKKKIPVSYLGMKKAKENYDLSFGRYKVGIGNPIELKDAQVQYQNSKLIYYQAMHDFNVSRANLEKCIGKNISSDGVELDNTSLNNK